MPSLETDGWELENVEEVHMRNPQTFHIASKEERGRLNVGQLVKLVFLFALQDETGPYIQGERIPLTVLYSEEGYYVGLLEDRPVSSTRVGTGDFVLFEAAHVATIYNSMKPPPLLTLGADEQAYVDGILQRISNYRSVLGSFGGRSSEPVSHQMTELEIGTRLLALEAQTMQVPPRFSQFHVAYANAAQHLVHSVALLKRSITEADAELLTQANEGMGQGLDTLHVYQSILNALNVASLSA